MPKLPTFSGRELMAILEKNGFLKVRQRGSHVVMQKEIEHSTITVPVPDHKELRIGTLRVTTQVFNEEISIKVE